MEVYSDATEAVQVNTATALQFKIRFSADLWANDTLVITVDSKWKLTGSLLCTSKDLTFGGPNYFKGNDGTHDLDCAYDSATRRIFVYGMAHDVDTSVLGGDL